MALPGDRLTSAYRADQVRNAAKLSAKLRRRYQGVDLTNPMSGRNFIEVATQDVVTHHQRASAEADTYLRALHSLEGPRGLVVVDRAEVNLEQIRRSLAAVGLGMARQRLSKVQGEVETPAGRQAMERAVKVAKGVNTAAVMGAGIRLAQDGARDTVREFVKQNGTVKGYVRVTAGDDKVCYFCAMLASRIDWKEGSFDDINDEFVGPGTAKVHDSCRCHLRPIYSRELPDETIEYRRWWAEFSGAAIDGDDRGALKNFRRGEAPMHRRPRRPSHGTTEVRRVEASVEGRGVRRREGGQAHLRPPQGQGEVDRVQGDARHREGRGPHRPQGG
jgi:hypothetical protein